MTKNGKCLWIIDTLLQAGELSLRDERPLGALVAL